MGRRKKKAGTRKATRSSSTGSYTIADLEALLEERRVEVSTLENRRRELLDELAAVDAELSSLEGTAVRGRRGASARRTGRGPGRPASRTVRSGNSGRSGKVRAGPGRRPPGTALVDYIRKVLTAAGGPMQLKDIGPAVVRAGYATNSANLALIISQRLPGMKDVRKVGRGLYAIGPGAKTTTTKKTRAKKSGRKKGRRKKAS